MCDAAAGVRRKERRSAQANSLFCRVVFGLALALQVLRWNHKGLLRLVGVLLEGLPLLRL